MFENAKWICNNTENGDQSIYFRKHFNIDKQVEKAVLSVCALGLGVYNINGELVTEDVLCTPFTRYDKKVIYSQYDIKNLLKIGGNAIGIHCGNGFYNDNAMVWNNFGASFRDKAKVIACIKIEFQDGSNLEINTDTSWKTQLGSRTYNHMRQGECCDANLRQDGYSTPGFDDNEWDFAKIAKPPGGRFDTTNMPPIRIIREIHYVSKNGNIYDFGINTSGWVKITVTGEKGQKISIKYDETLNEDGDLRGHINMFNIKDNLLLKHEDVFICSGKENEVFAPHFCYHGFRYVKIENAPENIQVVLQVVHTDLKVIGEFICEDEMLQKIHNCSVNSIRTNFHGIPTDCPQREQNGWTGDAQLSAEAALMNLDIKDAYIKWLDDFKDVQRESGQLPGIIPTTNWGYNWGSGPAWDCAIIVIPWNVYLFTGDKTILSNMWDNMCLYMKYFDYMTDKGVSDFGLGDWCSPEWDVRCPNNVTDTAYHYYCLSLMSKISKVLGKEDIWQEEAVFVRNAWRNRFMDDETLYQYQTFYACAVYMGLLDKDEETEYVNKLVKMITDNNNRFECGILGIKFIFNVLSENGYMDLLYKAVINPESPSYAYWINNGATALCEAWSMKSSNNHHMFSEVDNWFYKYIAGICYTEEGLFINPKKQSFLNGFTAKHGSLIVSFDGRTFTVQGGKGVTFKFDNYETVINQEIFNYTVR